MYEYYGTKNTQNSILTRSFPLVYSSSLSFVVIVVYPAPPLTLDNVLAAIKGVTNWRKLGNEMVDDSILDDIQEQHDSDEACLKALVEAFILGECDFQPSWRRVIHALLKADEIYLAEMIKINAEPQQGECMEL